MNLTGYQKLMLMAMKMIITWQSVRLILLSCSLGILIDITGLAFRIFPVEEPKHI